MSPDGETDPALEQVDTAVPGDAAAAPAPASDDVPPDAPSSQQASDADVAEASTDDSGDLGVQDATASPTEEGSEPDAASAAARAGRLPSLIARARSIVAIVPAALGVALSTLRRRLRRQQPAPDPSSDADATAAGTPSEPPPVAGVSADEAATEPEPETPVAVDDPAAELAPDDAGDTPPEPDDDEQDVTAASAPAASPSLLDDPRARLGIAALAGGLVVVAFAIGTGYFDSGFTEADIEAARLAAIAGTAQAGEQSVVTAEELDDPGADGVTADAEEFGEAALPATNDETAQPSADQLRAEYRRGYFDGQDCAVIDGGTGRCLPRSELVERVEQSYDDGWNDALSSLTRDLSGDGP